MKRLFIGKAALFLIGAGATLLSLSHAGSVSPINAHGLGNRQLEQVEAGPYLISAWSDPETLKVGEELHITVSVQDKNEEFVLDADVQVRANLETDFNQQASARATHENAVQKMFYEAELKLRQAGRWQITLTIEAEPGIGEATFSLPVESGNAGDDEAPWLWIGAGLAGLGLMVGLGIQRIRQNRFQEKGNG
jgi:hypothetical protein